MAKDDKVNMPMSSAGITRYFEGVKSKIMLKPASVVVLIAGVIIFMLIMHAYGNGFMGL